MPSRYVQISNAHVMLTMFYTPSLRDQMKVARITGAVTDNISRTPEFDEDFNTIDPQSDIRQCSRLDQFEIAQLRQQSEVRARYESWVQSKAESSTTPSPSSDSTPQSNE